MDIYFYNTLTKKKDKFEPLNPDEIRIYSCGPTVYKDATIGNMRTNIFQDVLRRTLRYNGYKIKHVMNITDVGHLVSDGDEGEDKMLKSAREEHKTPLQIAEHYTKLFFDDLSALNIETPEIVCKATEHIKEMLEYVKKLIENGYAYETSTAIYFDISKLDKYPILSNLDVEKQKAGARVEIDPEKRNPQDFALWIKAPENHLMKWDSFWGKCYPGWHLECSAMGHKYLGEEFDIHTGGVDHIPVHHENEIAQGKGFCGKIPAHYWMHVEFLQVNGGKMSKSLCNLYTLDDLKERGYEPYVYRMFNFSSHYRKKINFTFEAMDSAKITLARLRDGYLKHLEGTEDIDNEQISQYEQKFLQAINDDLNMPVAMSVVWDVIKNPVKSKKLANLILKFDEVLGFNLKEYKKEEIVLPQEIQELVNKRNEARANKNWAESDKLRDELTSKGYLVKDSKEGTIVSKN